MTRTRMLITSLVTLVLCTTEALAGDYTVSGNVNASTVDATIAGGGDIIFGGDWTITMDQTINNVTGITVNANADGVIDFDNGTPYTIEFAAGAASISLNATGPATLTILVGAAGSGIDFGTQNTAGQVLTINRPIAGGAVVGNRIVTGEQHVEDGYGDSNPE